MFSHDRPAKNLVGEELTCRIEKLVSLFIYMPVECSYYHSVSGLVPRQVVTVLSFYFRAELLVRLAGSFSSILLPIFFFSSQDVFRTFSQNEVLIIVFGFLELSFRCFTVVYLAKTPVVVFVRVYL